MAVFKKSTPRKSETKVIPDEKDGTLPYIEKEGEDELIKKEEGQLAVDVFQTADEIVVIAPVAGVKPSDLFIDITDEVLTIKGARNFQFKAVSNDYFTQECFWGSFSRSIILPESVDAGSVKASFKNGILTVRIPKVEKIRTRMIKIQEE
jgi:HSP20 family protein